MPIECLPNFAPELPAHTAPTRPLLYTHVQLACFQKIRNNLGNLEKLAAAADGAIFSMRKTPQLILLFIERRGGWVNEYPLLEFFGAMSLVEDLIALGYVEKSPLDNGWSKYAITDSGRALIQGYDPIAAGDLPSPDKESPPDS